MDIVTHKRCTKCGELKTVDSFVKDPKKIDGLYSSCKQCYKLKYAKNRDKEILRVKEYRSKNRDAVLSQKRKHYQDNRAIEIEKMRVRREKRTEADREYRVKNKAKINLTSSLWAVANKARKAMKLNLWRKNNPDKVSEQKRNRRAKERGSGGKVTHKEWSELKKKYNYTCLCCCVSEPNIILTQDHVVPLSVGGVHSIDNMQPLCQSCNSAKGTKTIDYRPRFVVQTMRDE